MGKGVALPRRGLQIPIGTHTLVVPTGVDARTRIADGIRGAEGVTTRHGLAATPPEDTAVPT